MELKPWQRDSANIIRLSLDQIRGETASGLRIAFMLLDMGAETIMKTYLSLPDRLTGAATSYSARRKAMNGGFHDVVEGVLEASKDSYFQEQIYTIQYYHSIRNKIYHEGTGATVHVEDVKAYCDIVLELLFRFLDVDLRDYLQKLDDQEKEMKEQTKRDHESNESLLNKYRELRSEFITLIECIFSEIAPHLLNPQLWYEANIIRNFYNEQGNILETEKKLYDFASTVFRVDIYNYLSDYVGEDDPMCEGSILYRSLGENDDFRLSRIIEGIPVAHHIINRFELRDLMCDKITILSAILWQIAPSHNPPGYNLRLKDYGIPWLGHSWATSPLEYRFLINHVGQQSEINLLGKVTSLEKSLIDVKRFYITLVNK
jgi:hypothetical protein